MNQQINLYQPIFRQERKLFSLKTVSVALGIVAVSLLGMWALGAHNVGELQKAVTQLKEQQAAQEQMAQAAGVLLDSQGSPSAVQAEVKDLSAKIADRTNALALLRSGAAGEPRGFAPRLQALARQHVEGVWLDELFIGGGPHGLALRGRSVSPELIPKYLQMLTTEPELSGSRFDSVAIDRRESHLEPTPAELAEKDKKEKHTSPIVRFSVSSNAIADGIAAREQGT